MKRQRKPVATPEGLYRGYMYMECEDCGRRTGFVMRIPTDHHRCECRHRTVLKDVVMMYVNCPKCGLRRSYRTNIKAKAITHDCPVCHAPVDIEWSEIMGAYVTIDE